MRSPRILLIGPYDPLCGEYTFLAPPLGVWRLAGVLESAGAEAKVFDPNCCAGPPGRALERELLACPWDVIGVSTTGMTLRFDLELAHLARRLAPRALLVAGGMEATFGPELMFRLGPFDCVVLGEGERPMLELVARLRSGASLRGITGTAERAADGGYVRMPQRALDRTELRDAIFRTPYEKMPYSSYWDRLEDAYRVGALPTKAAREARLAEVRSVRLITLNYCPMGCTFCSSTNFLHEAQGSVASIARLDAEECVQMLQRIVSAHPRVRTVIFQDDIFVFTKDRRILPLCEAIIAAKDTGALPRELQFISTNRIDGMSPGRRLRGINPARFCRWTRRYGRPFCASSASSRSHCCNFSRAPRICRPGCALCSGFSALCRPWPSGDCRLRTRKKCAASSPPGFRNLPTRRQCAASSPPPGLRHSPTRRQCVASSPPGLRNYASRLPCREWQQHDPARTVLGRARTSLCNGG